MSQLESVFGETDTAVLEQSPSFSNRAAAVADSVVLASECPNYRLICCQAHTEELQAVLEPEPPQENLAAISHSAWQGLRRALAAHKPRLAGAVVIDSASEVPVAKGSLGFWAHVKRIEFLVPIIVSLVSAAWFGVYHIWLAKPDAAMAESVFSSIAAWSAGGLALFVVIVISFKKKIRWQTSIAG